MTVLLVIVWVIGFVWLPFDFAIVDAQEAEQDVRRILRRRA
jgi:hypothetical protein